jgi:hypothetical protein
VVSTRKSKKAKKQHCCGVSLKKITWKKEKKTQTKKNQKKWLYYWSPQVAKTEVFTLVFYFSFVPDSRV